MKKFLFVLFCLFSSLYAFDEPDIVVELESRQTLSPIKIEPFTGPEADYAKKLEEVLRFDLFHNGYSRPVDGETPHATIEGHLNGKTLSISLTFSHTQEIKELKKSLTGYFNQDRQRIHEASDEITWELFQVKGIATSRFLFTRRTPLNEGWASNVWEADYDGANAIQLTHDIGYCLTPAYLPPLENHETGSYFFTSYKSGQSKIYVCDKKGKRAQLGLSLSGNQLMPAISRQRDKMAFIWDVMGTAALFVQRFDTKKGPMGKPQQLSLTRYAVQGTPSFSPDGKRLAFVSNKDGLPRIYLLTLPKAGEEPPQPTLLTKWNRECTAPAFSPDGKMIAYCSTVKGARQICLAHLDSGTEEVLTMGNQNKENPTWARDSFHLLYNTTSGGSEIYLLDLNTRKPCKIDLGKGEKRFPALEP